MFPVLARMEEYNFAAGGPVIFQLFVDRDLVLIFRKTSGSY
jgi:hypothetical protein